MAELTHFSLFAGIGGIDLAAEWAGFESVGQCEFADYPTKVLEKHWPNVPRWRDIRDVTADSVRARGITNITVLSGGFPCQPFSVAGKQKGKDDDRYLWPEMLRVIHELQPAWVVGENVPGIINMALEQVCAGLENEGYEVQPVIIPASAVDAWHQRKRVFIMAHSVGNGRRKIRSRESASSSEIVADTNGEGLQAQWITGRIQQEERETCPGVKRRSVLGGEWDSARWEPEPNVGRVANGIPKRVDRLKCLGNAVVPQQIYPILQAIADIEGGKA